MTVIAASAASTLLPIGTDPVHAKFPAAFVRTGRAASTWADRPGAQIQIRIPVCAIRPAEDPVTCTLWVDAVDETVRLVIDMPGTGTTAEDPLTPAALDAVTETLVE